MGSERFCFCAQFEETCLREREGRLPQGVRCHKDFLSSEEEEIARRTAQMRVPRDQLFMRAAFLFSEQSTCLRGNVGAVIVKDRRIISTGYNGAPPGLPHCTEVGCEEYGFVTPDELIDKIDRTEGRGQGGIYVRGMRRGAHAYLNQIEDDIGHLIVGCRRAIHAEANAVAFAARAGVPTQGATIYCTHAPCLPCSQLIISAGIEAVYYAKEYRAAALDLLDKALVQVRKVEVDG